MYVTGTLFWINLCSANTTSLIIACVYSNSIQRVYSYEQLRENDAWTLETCNNAVKYTWWISVIGFALIRVVNTNGLYSHASHGLHQSGLFVPDMDGSSARLPSVALLSRIIAGLPRVVLLFLIHLQHTNYTSPYAIQRIRTSLLHISSSSRLTTVSLILFILVLCCVLISFISFVLTKAGKLLQCRIYVWHQLSKHTQQLPPEKPYVPSTTFGRATMGANGVANK